MAEIGLGYGSEFQLMRFLGHHREELNMLIQNATRQYGDIKWLDFPYDDNRISGDGEWKGINCFCKHEQFAEIKAKWNNFWPQGGTSMNWDGIFTIGDTWYSVEAKAHKDESYQKCGASVDSKVIIDKAFNKTIQWLNAQPKNKWINSDCYQLANRLAFMYFCNKECGIKTRLLYIGFVNGFRRKKDEVQNAEDWMEIWNHELCTLGIDRNKVEPYISFIHPNCENESISKEKRNGK